MDITIFDGKAQSALLENQLLNKLRVIAERPKLVSLLIGENMGSKLYLSLKSQAAKRLGLTLEVENFGEDTPPSEIVERIRELNDDDSVTGIMVQLPFPDSFSQLEKETVIDAISDGKDVDGMKKESPFVAPVVLSAISALKESGLSKGNLAIVGVEGFVGRKLKDTLGGFKITPLDSGSDLRLLSDSDIVISATGIPGLIKSDFLKNGVKCIDVGAPKAEFEDSVRNIASFLTPVPGGIGPLTISYLMYNLVEAIVANRA